MNICLTIKAGKGVSCHVWRLWSPRVWSIKNMGEFQKSSYSAYLTVLLLLHLKN